MNNGFAKLSLWVVALAAAATLDARRRLSVPAGRAAKIPRRRRPALLARAHPPPAADPPEPTSPNLPRAASEPAEPAAPETTGRAAETPSQIPARGWREALSRVWDGISRHRILAIAAGVTFYALLAIFPAIAAMVAIYSLFSDPSTIRTQVESLSGVLPTGAIQVMGDEISRVAAQGNATLGLATGLGLLVALWSANAGVKAIFDALNIVYQEEEKRGFFKLNAVSLAFTLGGIVLALLAIAAVVALPPLLAHIGLPEETKTLYGVLRWPIILAVISLAVAAIYRYGPSRNEAAWRWLSWGGAFFAVAWLAASLLFSWYAANFGSYNKTYGSLGAAVGFMTWIWITNIVLLIGAELNAELEHQTATDTTRGPPRPMGARGATMADTLGAARE